MYSAVQDLKAELTLDFTMRSESVLQLIVDNAELRRG